MVIQISAHAHSTETKKSMVFKTWWLPFYGTFTCACAYLIFVIYKQTNPPDMDYEYIFVMIHFILFILVLKLYNLLLMYY